MAREWLLRKQPVNYLSKRTRAYSLAIDAGNGSGLLIAQLKK